MHTHITFNLTPLKRRIIWISLLMTILLMTAACTSDWVAQADSIIVAVLPAIVSALGLLSAFGVGISPAVMQSITAWATEAQNDLNNVVRPLIDQYNAAEKDAKPGILNEIQAALGVISGNMSNLIASIHVSNPRTTAQIKAVFAAIQAELVALGNLVPVVSGAVTNTHDQIRAVHALKSAQQFRESFNILVDAFGTEGGKYKLTAS